MTKFLAARGLNGTPKMMAYLCERCTPSLVDFLGVQLPDFEKVAWRKAYQVTHCPKCLEEIARKDTYCRHCGFEL